MHELDVLVLGEANVDLIVRAADPTPQFGCEKLVEDLTLTVGGSASIFACQAAKLGLRTALVSVVGRDELGRFLLGALAEQGVRTGHIRQEGHQKTGATLSLTAAHDRALLTYLGTIAALDSAAIEPRWLASARHVHVASYFLQPRLAAGLTALLAGARAAGSTVSLDTGWDPADRWDGELAACLGHVDVFLPNELEAQRIARAGSVEEALARLAGRIPVVAVKLGAAGAVARLGQETARAAPPPVEVVDTTGAGDSFAAGFIAGYLQGLPLAGCLELGVLCGALSTRGLGGTATQATLAEVQAPRQTLQASS